MIEITSEETAVVTERHPLTVTWLKRAVLTQREELRTLNEVIQRRIWAYRVQANRLIAVKGLHRRYENDGNIVCTECLKDWPCATYDAASGGWDENRK